MIVFKLILDENYFDDGIGPRQGCRSRIAKAPAARIFG